MFYYVPPTNTDQHSYSVFCLFLWRIQGGNTTCHRINEKNLELIQNIKKHPLAINQIGKSGRKQSLEKANTH